MVKVRLQALLKSEFYSDLTLAKKFANPKKYIEFQSNIIKGKQAEEISVLLRKAGLPLINTSLVFRASEHGFSADTYHSKVQGLSPTITLIKTTTGKIFGCYLNCKIAKTGDWIPDASRKSFIFSLTQGTIHKLKDD
jgi:hypothetical protein